MSETYNSRLYLILTLAFLSAFGPFVTDMYLPALPAMTGFFQTTASKVQLGITTSMIGLAIGQLIVGPVSDRYGRRRPLILSLWLYLLSTLLCIVARDIGSFVTFRLLQGLAGAGGIVLSRSVSADLFSGKELVRFFAIIAAVNGLAPVLAPVAGGAVLGFTDWQGIFWLLFALGAVLLVMCYFFRETLPPQKRSRGGLREAFAQILPVVRNGRFMGYVMLLSVAMAGMFAYISASPFIFQQHYGLSPMAYGIYFGVNAIGIALGNIVSVRFRSPRRALRFGASGLLIAASAAGLTLFAGLGFRAVCVPVFGMLFFCGMLFPHSSALAIESERRYTGTASAVLGAMSFVLGGIVTPLVGLGDILCSTGIAFIATAALAFTLAMTVTRRKG